MALPILGTNDPGIGSISWTQFTIQYAGVPYLVLAGNTLERFVWWRFNAGVPTLEAGPELPADLGVEDFVLFGNKDGTPLNIQTAGLIEGGLIVQGSILTDSLAADSVTGTKILAGTINSTHILTGSITAELLESTIILVSDLLGGEYDFEAGEWVGGHWEATKEGILLYDADGRNTIALPTDAEQAAKFEGNVTATSLTVLDYLALRGQNNEFSKGSVTTLATGTTAPQSPPQPSIGWTNKPQAFGAALSLNGVGLAVDGPNFWCLTSFFGGIMQKFVEDTGTFNPVSGAFYDLGSWMQPTGITVLGAYVYVIGRDTRENVGGFGKFYVWKYDKTNGSYVSRWQYQPSGDSGLYSNFDPAIGNNGTNLLISQCRNSATNDKSVWIRTYNTAGALQSTVQTNHLPGDHQVSILYGNFDYGSARYLMTSRSGRITAYATTAAGVRSANDDFILPKSSWGQVWDGGVFKTSTADGVCIHSSINWANSAVDKWWVAHSWFDSNATGGQHETLISKKVPFLMKKRANLTITTPPLPAATGDPDDVTGVRIYHGTGASEPAAVSMKRALTDLPQRAPGDTGPGTTTKTYTAPLDMSTSANTGTPGPFAATSPAVIQSTTGGLLLSGDGTAQGRDPVMPLDFATKRYVDIQVWGSISRSAVQSLTNNAETPVVFTSGDVTAATVSGGVTATTAGLVAPISGLYTVRPIASFAAAAATGSRILVIRVNGVNKGGFGLPLTAAPSGFPVSDLIWLDAGDVVTYNLYQSSGANINCHNQSYPGLKIAKTG